MEEMVPADMVGKAFLLGVIGGMVLAVLCEVLGDNIGRLLSWGFFRCRLAGRPGVDSPTRARATSFLRARASSSYASERPPPSPSPAESEGRGTGPPGETDPIAIAHPTQIQNFFEA